PRLFEARCARRFLRGRTGDAKIFEHSVPQKAEDFVATAGGLDEFRILVFNVPDEPWLVVAKLEVVVVLLNLDNLAVTGVERAVGLAIFFRQKRFFFQRIETFVLSLVKMTGFVKL